jgi:O-antigen/teichoic acid export membrane protein
MDDLKSKVKSGFIWEASTKLVIQSLSWISTVFVARWLTPEDYGIIAVSGVFVVFFTVFAEMGLTSGLINKKEISKEEVNGVFWLSLCISFTLMVMLILASPLVERIFDMQGLANIIAVASTVFVIASLRCIPTALVLRDLNYRYQALVGTLAQFVQVCTVMPLAYYGYGPWSLVYSTIAMQLVMTIAYLPQIKKIGMFSIKWHEIKEVVTYGTKMMSSTIMNTLSELSSSFLVGFILGQREVGVFSMAQQLAKIPLSKIGVIFNRVLFPAISRIKEDTTRAKELFLKFHRVLLMCTYPILIGTAFIAHDLVLILFTEKWLLIVPILQIICVLNLVQVSSMVMSPMLNGFGMPELIVRYNLLLLILLPIATVIGLQWSITGMLIGWCVVYPAVYVYLFLKLKKALGFTFVYFVKTIQSVLFATLVMSIALIYLDHVTIELATYVRLSLFVITGVCAYSSVYILFYRSELVELKSVFVGAKA